METGKTGQLNFNKINKLLFVLFLLFISITYSSGQLCYQEQIYNAFIKGQMDLWEDHMKKMEENYYESTNIQCLYDLTYTLYGYIAYCIIINDKSKGRYYLNKARKYANTLLKYHSSQAEIYSLQGALYGFEIGLNPIKAIDFGIKSVKSINKAVELDKDNAKVLMELGNMKYYMPKILGGGLKKAIYYHEKAVFMFELGEYELDANWLYLLVLTNLGRWYSEAHELSKANDIYRKILDIEPNYLWVKNYLYPDLAEKR